MPNKLIKYVSDNFSKPNGFGGKISTFLMNRMNQKQYKALLKNIKLQPNDTILDIGFGNGYLINKLLKQNTTATIYGIEISKDMLTYVTKKQKHNIENGKLNLSLQNIEKTSFYENMFDKIYTINTFYFWNDLIQCFSEIKRILKPNGIFFNIFYTKEYLDKTIFSSYGFKKYTVDDIKNITKQYGMEIIETIEIKKNKMYYIISHELKG